MSLVFVAIAAIGVVAVGLIIIGRVTADLEGQVLQPTFDVDAAVVAVADGLPQDVAAEISYEDVLAILGWHLDYLEQRGLVLEQSTEADSDVASATVPTIVDEDDGLAWVLGQIDESERDITDRHAVEVLAGQARYLRAIGALGPQVREPVDPDTRESERTTE